jgi:hypothetical protein
MSYKTSVFRRHIFTVGALNLQWLLLCSTVEQSSLWEAGSPSASQISCLLRNLMFHYRFHDCPLAVAVVRVNWEDTVSIILEGLRKYSENPCQVWLWQTDGVRTTWCIDMCKEVTASLLSFWTSQSLSSQLGITKSIILWAAYISRPEWTWDPLNSLSSGSRVAGLKALLCGAGLKNAWSFSSTKLPV